MSRGTCIAALVCGAIAGYGLSLSTMIDPTVILSFLRWQDFGLMLVMGGALAVTLLTYQLAPRVLPRPILGGAFGQHPAVMDKQTLVGAAIFGIGWGLSGVCPGPAIAGIGAGNAFLVVPLIGMFLGAYVQGRLADLLAPLATAK